MFLKIEAVALLYFMITGLIKSSVASPLSISCLGVIYVLQEPKIELKHNLEK